MYTSYFNSITTANHKSVEERDKRNRIRDKSNLYRYFTVC